MKVLIRRLAIPMASLVALEMIAGNAVAQALSAAELMTDANERYSRGEYSEAVQQYESLIGDGFRDSALYYNLGNAYSQQEDLGRAILNYLRAARLSPRDPDINANLVLVRSQTVDNLQVEGDSLVASLSRFAHRLVTPAEMGSAVLLLWTMGGLALAALFTASGSHRLAVLLRTIVACASMSALIVLPLWLSRGHVNMCVNVIRRQPSLVSVQRRFRPCRRHPGRRPSSVPAPSASGTCSPPPAASSRSQLSPCPPS